MDTGQVFRYSSLSELNTLEVYLGRASRYTGQTKLWIVYIHGGAWRDPRIDASSIQASLSRLTPASAQIEGVASLNYRLSDKPGSNDAAHNALHPDHVEDVLTAICWLQNRYNFGERYILVGHSAGASLAFQAISGQWKAQNSTPDYPLTSFVTPVAVAGLAGIYDIKTLLESFSAVPFYRSFIEAAFGDNESVWKEASPTYIDLSHQMNVRCIVLADSNEDELIDPPQSDKMWSHLTSHKGDHRLDFHMRLHGDHDSMWRQGDELANVILRVFDLLKRPCR